MQSFPAPRRCLAVSLSMLVLIASSFALADEYEAVPPQAMFDNSSQELTTDFNWYNFSSGELNLPVVSPSMSTSPHEDDQFWADQFAARGITGNVTDLVTFNGELIIGGHFVYIDGQEVGYIAAYDGVSFRALGLGMNGLVEALAVYNGQLVAAGRFSTAGGATAERIATWDGSNWSPLGDGFDGSIYALAVYDSQLVAGGGFAQASGNPGNNIAAWDGSSWSSFGDGTNGAVKSLCLHNGNLIAGGGFTTAGSVSANSIAAWDGSSWSTFGSGMNRQVRAVTSFGSDLIAGGQFNIAGGISANRLARWDGTAWSAMGVEAEGIMDYLAVIDGVLYAAGGFLEASGVRSNVAQWNGATWVGVGPEFEADVQVLYEHDGEIMAGGYEIDGVLASWNGLEWYRHAGSNDGMGVNGYVFDAVVYNDQLVVGGYFDQAGGESVGRIASWNGISWTAFGGGVTRRVEALTVYNGDLIAAGDIYTAEGDSVGRVVRWDGVQWHSITDGITRQEDGWVQSLAVYDGLLIIGSNAPYIIDGYPGETFIAAWDGANWLPLGDGLIRDVDDLTVWDGKLIAAGRFETAGPPAIGQIAAWDGFAWTDLSTGFPYQWYHTITVYEGDLFAGGVDLNGDRSFVSKWMGTSWQTVGTFLGGVHGWVEGLGVFGGHLIATGTLDYETSQPSVPLGNIAAYNGSCWMPLGSGLNYLGKVIIEYDYKMYVGGLFSEAGGKLAGQITYFDGEPSNCCDLPGDIDRNGTGPDIADLVALVDYMFNQGLELECFSAANVNGLDSCYPDIGDLVHLVDFMFTGGAAPVCP